MPPTLKKKIPHTLQRLHILKIAIWKFISKSICLCITTDRTFLFSQIKNYHFTSVSLNYFLTQWLLKRCCQFDFNLKDKKLFHHENWNQNPHMFSIKVWVLAQITLFLHFTNKNFYSRLIYTSVNTAYFLHTRSRWTK